MLEAVLPEVTGGLGRYCKAWENGCKFDGWNEYFNYDVWMKSFNEEALSRYANRERNLMKFYHGVI